MLEQCPGSSSPFPSTGEPLMELLALPWLIILLFIRIPGEKDDLLFRCHLVHCAPLDVVSRPASDVEKRQAC